MVLLLSDAQMWYLPYWQANKGLVKNGNLLFSLKESQRLVLYSVLILGEVVAIWLWNVVVFVSWLYCVDV